MDIKIINNKFEKKEFSIDKLIEMYNNKEFDVFEELGTKSEIFYKVILDLKYEDKHKGITLSLSNILFDKKEILHYIMDKEIKRVKNEERWNIYEI